MPFKPGDIVQVRHGIDGVVPTGEVGMVRAVGYGRTGRDILVWFCAEYKPHTEVWFWAQDLGLVESAEERLRDAERPLPPSRRPWWKRLLWLG